VTPFGAWSYDFTEEEAAAMLAACPTGCVLISHSPPYGAVDTPSGRDHMGSTAVRDTILRAQPKLVVCGHIHACGGRSEILGQSPVVNPGPSGIVRTIP
jgi:Icc-related predicted phosphoesterase